MFAGMGYVDLFVAIRAVVGGGAVLGGAAVDDGFGCLDVFQRLFVAFAVVVKVFCEQGLQDLFCFFYHAFVLVLWLFFPLYFQPSSSLRDSGFVQRLANLAASSARFLCDNER